MSPAIAIIGCVIFMLTLYLHRKKKGESGERVPPGSMGWPYVGETLELYSEDPSAFFLSKQKRYGDIFKSRILGCPCIMLASPEAARFVLVTHAHLFKPTYPKSKERLIGPSALFFHQGDYHLSLRKAVRSSLSLHAARTLAPDISAIAASITDSWQLGEITHIFPEMKRFSFEVGVIAIFGELAGSEKDELRRCYCVIDKGYNSFPSTLPWTRYRRALKARETMSDIITKIIVQRKKSQNNNNNVLGHLQRCRNHIGELLTDAQIADNVIGVLFAAQDTTASALTWIIKYLHDNPKVLCLVKEENRNKITSLNWNALATTRNVIFESLRLSSIISFAFREAVADVEFNGYLIPKGWKVMPLFRNIHHNEEYFKQPKVFEPSRFEKTREANTFLTFGTGSHACPGNELAMEEMHTMIHHLVTRYDWELVGLSDKIQHLPFPIPYQGLPTRFRRAD